MNPQIAVWFTFSAVIIGAIVSSLREDNTSLPFTLSTGLRASLALALGAVQTCLMAIVGGTPWITALGTACASVIVAFLAHGAPHVASKAVALLCLISLASLSSACSFFSPKRVHAVEDITMCVLAHRDLPPADVAVTCGLQDAQDVVDIVTGEQQRMAAAHRAGVDEARALGCK